MSSKNPSSKKPGAKSPSAEELDRQLFASAQNRVESDMSAGIANDPTVILTIKVSSAEAKMLYSINNTLISEGGMPHGNNYVNACNTIRFGLRLIAAELAGEGKAAILGEYRAMCEQTRLLRYEQRKGREQHKAKMLLGAS